MTHYCEYDSPIGKLTLASKRGYLIGLWMEGQKYFFPNPMKEKLVYDKDEFTLRQTCSWLDQYFEGRNPEPGRIMMVPDGSWFRQQVYEVLVSIPYGKTMTYKEVSEKVAIRLNKEHMSCQAVGQAIGHNPISIIIPCHRVIGTDGSLKGYAGGLDRKKWLLDYEKKTKL